MLVRAGTLNSVETYLETKANYVDSGARVHYGTWESAVYGLAHYDELRSLRSKLYPERLPQFKPSLKSRGMLHKSELNGNWALPFLGSDRSVVLRSQRFFYEHDKKRPVQIHTYFSVPSFLAVIGMAIFGFVFGLMTKFSFGRSLLLKVLSSLSILSKMILRHNESKPYEIIYFDCI